MEEIHPTRDTAESELVLANATLITGTGSPPRADQTIVVVDDRIRSIGTGGAGSSSARVVDCAGKFVMPGIWDMHVHFCMPGAGAPAMEAFVRRGITSARDLGGDPWILQEWRDRVSTGDLLGPSLYRAGPVVDAPKPLWRLPVRTASEARAAVTTLRTGLGSDVIKVHDALPRAAFFALAEEARAQGIHVASHLPQQVSVEEVVEAGGRSVEHVAESLCVSAMLHSGAPAKTPEEAAARLLGAEGRSMFDTIVRQRAWVDPTLTAYSTFVTMDAGNDPPSVPLRQAMMGKLSQAVRLMRDRGVKLITGSDHAGSLNALDATDEIGLLQAAGLSPSECLEAATRNSAECMGRLSEVGTIEEGKIADLLVLDANPLADARNVKKVHFTVARGRVVLPS